MATVTAWLAGGEQPTSQFAIGSPIEANPYVRHLQRIMRDGRPKTLAQAVDELCEVVPDRTQVELAAELIQEKAREVTTAQLPRAIVADHIESWYFGPREADRNWPRLVDELRSDGWGDTELGDLDQSSTKIVAQLPNPAGDGVYHCRGLVLGYVQSGKTTNFTAVIAKAADAGYRLIVVLSGMHDALRNQTQDRLNHQLWAPSTDLWHRLTNESDFRPTASVDALLSGGGEQRVLAIVKKNASRLRALRTWLAGARPEVLAECPILIIDDEADQASVNTAKPDRQPQTINRLIREIVNESPRSAYIGYTATPFANVLIDPQDYGDLYPRDFIIDLPRPANYLGAEAVFGRDPVEHDADEVDDGHDLIRIVPDGEISSLRPKGSADRHRFEPEVTPSLDEALRYFMLSTAARQVRGQGNPHATALVHTSQHVLVHQQVAAAIGDHLYRFRRRLHGGDAKLLEQLSAQWSKETARVPSSDFGLPIVTWDELVTRLPFAADEAVVITDNSQSDERLNFDRNHPRVIVAVGGNTLSRGLTLEGLAVSFFVRSASAYDTLLQMGRWFGYRAGYADLTRIWMTEEMRTWFRHLATVEQEIRYDIARYESTPETPEQLGVRIRTHPKLAVTAAAKMQRSRLAEVSYSGRRLQTIQFNHRDSGWLETNESAVRALLADSAECPTRAGGKSVAVIAGVDSEKVVNFLGRYLFHENSHDLNSDLIRRYILARNTDGELTRFNIALMGRHPARDDLGSIDLGTGTEIGCINRARLAGDPGYANIKALMSPADRAIDLPIRWADARELKEGEMARLRNTPRQGGIGDGSGLILIYPISKNSHPERPNEVRTALDAKRHVIGIGMVFPVTASRSAAVDYVTADIASMPGVEIEAPDDPTDETLTE